MRRESSSGVSQTSEDVANQPIQGRTPSHRAKKRATAWLRRPAVWIVALGLGALITYSITRPKPEPLPADHDVIELAVSGMH